MISVTLVIICGLAGIVCLLAGLIGPGLGLLVIAGVLVLVARVELEAADQRRRDRFLIAYEKAQREAPLDLRNHPHLWKLRDTEPSAFDEEVTRLKAKKPAG